MEVLLGLVIAGQFGVIIWLLQTNKDLGLRILEHKSDVLIAAKAPNAAEYVTARAAQKDADVLREQMQETVSHQQSVNQFSARAAEPTKEFPATFTTPDGKELKVLRPIG